MSVIPCQRNDGLAEQIREFAEVLKTEAHTLGNHNLSETDFYQGGLFRGAIERVRGQFSATMREKRDFVGHVLNCMQDRRFIHDWESSGEANRHDYTVTMPSGRVSVIELKGCLDGNNTNIFERPAHAQEFIIWSVCSNAGSDPRHSVWSGVHTRLSCEIIDQGKVVDGLIVWDWLCGTVGRPCPKLDRRPGRQTVVGQFRLTPPCIYLFPQTLPSVGNNPNPEPHQLEEVQFLDALHRCFGGDDDELNFVRFTVAYRGDEVIRSTEITRGGNLQRASEPTAIRRR
jgi:hypothetical protein